MNKELGVKANPLYTICKVLAFLLFVTATISALLMSGLFLGEGGISDKRKSELLSSDSFISCTIGVFLIGFFIYSIAVKIKLKATLSKFVYMKKFEIWLAENEDINYTPFFKNQQQKHIYEGIIVTKSNKKKGNLNGTD